MQYILYIFKINQKIRYILHISAKCKIYCPNSDIYLTLQAGYESFKPQKDHIIYNKPKDNDSNEFNDSDR